MLPCPSCHCHVLPEASSCPHCGAERQLVEGSGARVLRVAAALALGLGLAACSPETSSEGESGQSVTTQMAEAEAETETETGAPPSTATVTSTGEDTSTEGETGTLTFVPDSDISALYGICDPFAQDCPEGEKCVAYDDTGTGVLGGQRCVEIMGDQAAGEPCVYSGVLESTDDCDADSFCYPTQEIDGLEQGVCAAFCGGTVDNSSCPDTTSCVDAFHGTLAVCLAQCDPFLQDCEAPQACHWARDDFNCTPVAAQLGEPCSDQLDDCGAGQLCAEADFVPMCAGERCCTEFCDLAEPACSVPGTTCVPFFEPEMALEGLEELGACVVD